MTTPTLKGLTPRHLELFGAIVQWFAHYELLIQDAMATLARSDAAAVMLLTRQFDFAEKRQALLDLLRHRPGPIEQFDRIRDYLVIPDNLTSLRDNIAHSSWKPGLLASGVQPNWILRIPRSIKPSRGDPKASGSYIEDDQDRIEYTIEDLSLIVDNLAENYALFAAYLHDVGLLPARN